MAFNRSARRKNNNPRTTKTVQEKTISNLYNESFAKSIGYGASIPEDGIYIALQNNVTGIETNIHTSIQADKETPIRGIIQFDLKNASSGVGDKDVVAQAVLFLKVKDVSPVWPGYDIDVCELQAIAGTGPTEDATWNNATSSEVWGTTGIRPQIGVGYSIREDERKPFSVNGFYPLYLSKSLAVKNSPTPREARTEAERKKGWIGYHEHAFDGVVYYMPNGLQTTGRQYHGNYRPSTPSQVRYGFNEYATENEARRRAIELGCIGFHTITRNGDLIYKPCKSSTDLYDLRVRTNKMRLDTSNVVSSPVTVTDTSPEKRSIPVSSTATVIDLGSSMTKNGKDLNIDEVDNEIEVLDHRDKSFVIGGGEIRKDTQGNEVKISKLAPKTIRKNQLLIFDVTSLVQGALGRGSKYLSLLLKGSHDASARRVEAKANAQVGPQDQYINFYSFNGGVDSTVYRGEFNTTRNEVTGSIAVDLYTSDSAGATPNAEGAYILRPANLQNSNSFNNFFGSVSSGDTITFQSGKVKINEETTVDIGEKTLTVEGYSKNYLQLSDNPIAGFTPGTYTGINVKMRKTTTVNEIEIVSSSNDGAVIVPLRAFEPFIIEYRGDSTGSNARKTFTPTSISRRNGNTIITVKEPLTEEQHVDHSGGFLITNLANSPRLKLYYFTNK